MSGPSASPQLLPVERISEGDPQPFVDALYEISTEEHFWFQWRRDVTLALLRDHQVPLDQPLKALEVGSGAGVFRRQLEQETAWRIDSTDLDFSALERCRSPSGRTLFYDVREQRPAFREHYDALVLFEVLEHIEDAPAFLQANLFHLKPGGYFLLDVPALQSFFSAYDRAAGHFRRYDRHTLAADFAGLDFEIVEMRYWGCSMLPLLLARNVASLTANQPEQIIRRGFAPPIKPLHGLLKGLMRAEIALLSRPFCGTSLLLLGRKGAAAQP